MKKLRNHKLVSSQMQIYEEKKDFWGSNFSFSNQNNFISGVVSWFPSEPLCCHNECVTVTLPTVTLMSCKRDFWQTEVEHITFAGWRVCFGLLRFAELFPSVPKCGQVKCNLQKCLFLKSCAIITSGYGVFACNL